jgi:2'-5' RNA ligase
MPHRLRRTRPALPRFAVAWFPRFEGIDRIEEFRRQHDPAAALIPAHVSLVFPFSSAHSRLQVETHVRNVLSRWPPIPVTFRRVRTEANEFVFLGVSRGAASIAALHDRLYTRSFAPHLRKDIPYEPHITLARCEEWWKLEIALAQAEAVFGGEFGEVMREATLLGVGPDGRIERLKTFDLDTA